MSEPVSATTIAEWMVSEMAANGELYQSHAASHIADTWGEPWFSYNDQGNMVISPEVLAKFRSLSGSDTVWSRGGLYWRAREAGDELGRSQP